MATSLAREVRTATDSEEFDLAGYNLQKCHDFCKAAFSEPLPLAKMVRLSFVCGGGKLTRQKYTDALPKEFMVALSESAGYSQDNAAALTMESAGTFKYQHDTNKNLIFVHVYPKLAPPEVEAAEEGEEEAPAGPRNPADVLAECEMEDFTRLLEARVVTYAGKRRVMDEIKARIAKMEAAEQKLINRETLNDEEQKMYDNLSIDTLKEKTKAVSAELQAMLEAGKLTAAEHAFVLEDFAGKLRQVEDQIVKAAGKEKMLQKLQEQKGKLNELAASVKEVQPCKPPPLRFAQDIQKLRLRVAGLTKLEAQKGTPFSIDQLKAIAEKPELEEAIEVLENKSRFWLETPEEFKLRLDQAMAQPVPKKKASSSGGGGGGSSSGGGGGGGWATVGKKR